MGSYEIPAFDCRMVESIIERMTKHKLSVETHTTLLKEHNNALQNAISDYQNYMDRIAETAGVAEPRLFAINFNTSMLELIPPPKTPQLGPRRAPDADEPPAPFRDTKDSPEVKV